MERFTIGMTCCKAGRVSVGLACSREQQLSCGTGRLAWCFEQAPESAGGLLSDLISTFPDSLAAILAVAEGAGMVRQFIERASRVCAALPNKTERHAFRDQITGHLSAGDLAAFDDQMTAEWRRLRGK